MNTSEFFLGNYATFATCNWVYILIVISVAPFFSIRWYNLRLQVNIKNNAALSKSNLKIVWLMPDRRVTSSLNRLLRTMSEMSTCYIVNMYIMYLTSVSRWKSSVNYMLHMLQMQSNLLLFDMLLVVQWINLMVQKDDENYFHSFSF